jgi:hypothetical protein
MINIQERKFEGYWVLGSKVIDVSMSEHAIYIRHHPEEFGFTAEELQKQYPYTGVDSKSDSIYREKLIIDVTHQGWVRVRHYDGPDYWSIQCDNTKRRSETIHDFMYWGIANKKMSYHDQAVLMGFDNDNDKEQYLFTDGGIATYLSESYKNRSDTILKEIASIIVDTELNEASLSRVLYHAKNGFFIISAFKSGNSLEQNYHSHIELKKLLKEWKLGYFELIGYWDSELYSKQVQEAEVAEMPTFSTEFYSSDLGSGESLGKVTKDLKLGSTLHTSAGGHDVHEIELSCFIPYNISSKYNYNQFLDRAEILRNHFDQQSFMALDINDQTVKLFNIEKNERVSLGQASVKNISYAYSRLRSNPTKSFLFEGIRRI